jgi:hypothetical protein
VRGSVTEWSNRTFYFADDVTTDLQLSASTDGVVVIALELYKHWYGLQNKFYPTAYGPRSLKAVLLVTHANGTTVFVSPTCSSSSANDVTPSQGAGTGLSGACAWRHGSGATTHEDLHTGQIADARLATPGWETSQFNASGRCGTPCEYSRYLCEYQIRHMFPEEARFKTRNLLNTN